MQLATPAGQCIVEDALRPRWRRSCGGFCRLAYGLRRVWRHPIRVCSCSALDLTPKGGKLSAWDWTRSSVCTFVGIEGAYPPPASCPLGLVRSALSDGQCIVSRPYRTIPTASAAMSQRNHAPSPSPALAGAWVGFALLFNSE